MNPIFGQKKTRICISCLNDSVFKYFRSIILTETIRSSSEDWSEPQDEELNHISWLKERIYLKKQEIERNREEIEEVQIVRSDYLKMYEEVGELGRREECNLEVLKKLKEEAGLKENLVKKIDKDKKKVKIDQEMDIKLIKLLNDQIYYLTALRKVYSHDVNVLNKEVAILENNTCSVF